MEGKKSTPISRSENMRRIRSFDTKPELLVRRMLWTMGYRYRLHRVDLPGKPDIVFPSKKKIIFIHGCFWHQHGDTCPDSHLPKSNQNYWLQKLRRNQTRDQDVLRALSAAGWNVLVVWECETVQEDLGKRLQTFLETDGI